MFITIKKAFRNRKTENCQGNGKKIPEVTSRPKSRKKFDKIGSLILLLVLILILGLILFFVLRKDSTAKNDYPDQETSSSKTVSFLVQKHQTKVEEWFAIHSDAINAIDLVLYNYLTYTVIQWLTKARKIEKVVKDKLENIN